MPRPVLVSACLLGILTRYSGETKRNSKVLNYLASNDLVPVPVCPEQLGGLSTPRPPTCFTRGSGPEVLDGSGEVTNTRGEVMNEAFVRGARETAEIARLCGCERAILKERSPSCGVRNVYLGKTIVPGQGVATALLARNGIEILSEEDI